MRQYNHWKKDQHKWVLVDYELQEKRSNLILNILLFSFTLILGIFIGGYIYG